MSGSVTGHKVFKTEVEAKEAGAQFLRDWPSWGYGSSIQVWQDQTDGAWHLSTYRWTSCD